MQILQIIPSMDAAAGGVSEGVMRLGMILASRGHGRDVVCLDTPDDPWIKDAPLRVIALGQKYSNTSALTRFIPWRRYRYSPDFVPWLKANVHKYDAVIVNSIWNYASFGARRALTGGAVPYFVFTHGMLDPWFRKTYPLKTALKQLSWWISEGPLLNGARAVLFTTEDERALARNAFWPYHPREAVVGFGTADVAGNSKEQIAAFRAKLPQLGERRFLLFLSRIHEKKGCDLLVEAFARQAAQHPDLDLVIAGPDHGGLIRKLTDMARHLGIEERVHWPGMLAGDPKWGAFQACEAFILPSHQENFGIVVAEAMACARPVLITNKVNIWREVEAGAGGLVENDDLNGVEGLIKRFLALPEAARDAMGRAARTTFLKSFLFENNVTTLIDLVGATNAK
jgi:glycosyltransferase involved in cell wall biosynthesis